MILKGREAIRKKHLFYNQSPVREIVIGVEHLSFEQNQKVETDSHKKDVSHAKEIPVAFPIPPGIKSQQKTGRKQANHRKGKKIQKTGQEQQADLSGKNYGRQKLHLELAVAVKTGKVSEGGEAEQKRADAKGDEIHNAFLQCIFLSQAGRLIGLRQGLLFKDIIFLNVVIKEIQDGIYQCFYKGIGDGQEREQRYRTCGNKHHGNTKAVILIDGGFGSVGILKDPGFVVPIIKQRRKKPKEFLKSECESIDYSTRRYLLCRSSSRGWF